MKKLNERVTRHASHLWYEGASFAHNPYEEGSRMWVEWAKEWGRLEDERNDMAASDDDRNTAVIHRWPDFARDENL